MRADGSPGGVGDTGASRVIGSCRPDHRLAAPVSVLRAVAKGEACRWQRLVRRWVGVEDASAVKCCACEAVELWALASGAEGSLRRIMWLAELESVQFWRGLDRGWGCDRGGLSGMCARLSTLLCPGELLNRMLRWVGEC